MLAQAGEGLGRREGLHRAGGRGAQPGGTLPGFLLTNPVLFLLEEQTPGTRYATAESLVQSSGGDICSRSGAALTGVLAMHKEDRCDRFLGSFHAS